MRRAADVREAWRMARRAPRILRNLALDLRFGRPLAGTVPTRFAHLGASDVGNSEVADLETLFARLEVAEEDVLVDVGCGKGRVLNFFLARYPRNRIVGIELDPEVCAGTARRLSRWPRVEVVCGDATTSLPADGTLFFLFNPFDEPGVRRFAAMLPGRAAGGRPQRVVYHNAKHLEPFLEDARFEVEEVRVGVFRSAFIRAR